MEKGFISGEQSTSLLSALKDSTKTIMEICGIMNENKAGKLCFTGMESQSGSGFTIDKDEYVIGRSDVQSDAVIKGNKSVGRIHCRVIRRGNSYYVEDLESVNGTFINGKRLRNADPAEIKEGDIVSISNAQFRIERIGSRFNQEE